MDKLSSFWSEKDDVYVEDSEDQKGTVTDNEETKADDAAKQLSPSPDLVIENDDRDSEDPKSESVFKDKIEVSSSIESEDEIYADDSEDLLLSADQKDATGQQKVTTEVDAVSKLELLLSPDRAIEDEGREWINAKRKFEGESDNKGRSSSFGTEEDAVYEEDVSETDSGQFGPPGKRTRRQISRKRQHTM